MDGAEDDLKLRQRATSSRATSLLLPSLIVNYNKVRPLFSYSETMQTAFFSPGQRSQLIRLFLVQVSDGQREKYEDESGSINAGFL